LSSRANLGAGGWSAISVPIASVIKQRGCIAWCDLDRDEGGRSAETKVLDS
jgi:hypothetical protein